MTPSTGLIDMHRRVQIKHPHAFYFYLCVYICAHERMSHRCRGLSWQIPYAEIACGCEPMDVAAGNQTWFLYKSSYELLAAEPCLQPRKNIFKTFPKQRWECIPVQVYCRFNPGLLWPIHSIERAHVYKEVSSNWCEHIECPSVCT